MNNWDARTGNTGVLRVTTGDAVEDWYLLTDVGTAFGGIGERPSAPRSKWTLKDYQTDGGFIASRDETALELYLRPDDGERARVPIEHARWLAALTSRLTERQVRRAFEAAGASDEEVRGFTRTFPERTRESDKAVMQTEP